ncbi:MAG: serine/threonine-protein kinase [Nocardioidaceae bacterium]
MATPAAPSTHTVGPYRLIGQIGEGGMGVVYLAQAPDDRRVAIKILRPSVVGDAHGRARLAREVTSLRRVRSPRIAEVYDADPWGETPYVVTRYVPGPSLREVVDQRGTLGALALTRFAHGLAQALVVVHRADVLHRDVKPSNVLIEDGEPVLIDFGLAQLSDDMTLTQTGWLLGTPGYLAPEILYGDGPTPAADVHAWAATVTFAATGRGPYGTGPAIAIMDRARRGESNLAGVPPGLADVLAAALRPEPSNRPTARQLVEWLDVRLAAMPAPVAVRPPELQPSAQEWLVPHGSTAAMAPLTAEPPDEGSRRWPRVAFWLSMLLLIVAGTTVAPLVTGMWVVCSGWVLRTLALGSATLRARRVAHGHRRRDETLCAILIPWFALRTSLSSGISALCVAVAAASFVALARFGPESVETPALVSAGVIAALAAWDGPLTRDVRRGGRIVTENLPRSGLAFAILVVLLLALATGLFAVQQVTGTSYAPFSG